MPRPRSGRVNLVIGLDPEILERLEQERALLLPIIPRTELIRRLIADALDARFMDRLRKPKGECHGQS